MSAATHPGEAEALVDAPSSGGFGFLRRARRSPSFIAGTILISLIVLSAVLAPWISPYSPNQQNLYHILSGFSSAHWLGTDELGRDELSRMLWAGRTDLRVGVLAVLFPSVFGTLMGTVSGYYGGLVDSIVMRFVDVLIAFPFYVLVIGLIFIVGTGTTGIYVAFAVVDWVVYARTIRAATLIVRESDYVAAAKVGGLPNSKILWRHVLPNTVAQSVVYVMSDIILVIVTIVTLGYLGLGVQPPTPDWGSMIAEGQQFDRDTVGASYVARPGCGDHRAGSLSARRRARRHPPPAMNRPVPASVAPRPRTDQGGTVQRGEGNEGALVVSELSISVERGGQRLRVVDNVSFEVLGGGSFGIVGESGSGKSLTLRAVMGLLPPGVRVESGRAELGGVALPFRGRDVHRSRRHRVSMIFQDPLSALDPVHTVGSQVAEVPRHVLGQSRRASRERAIELMALVGLPEPERRGRRIRTSCRAGCASAC